jgi:hypothetical protein
MGFLDRGALIMLTWCQYITVHLGHLDELVKFYQQSDDISDRMMINKVTLEIGYNHLRALKQVEGE